MPTQEMPDNELDGLFRKASEEYKTAYEPGAWRRMERLLDENDGRGGGYWRKIIILSVIALLVGTLTGWLTFRSGEKNAFASKRIATAKPEVARTETIAVRQDRPVHSKQENPVEPVGSASATDERIINKDDVPNPETSLPIAGKISAAPKAKQTENDQAGLPENGIVDVKDNLDEKILPPQNTKNNRIKPTATDTQQPVKYPDKNVVAGKDSEKSRNEAGVIADVTTNKLVLKPKRLARTKLTENENPAANGQVVQEEAVRQRITDDVRRTGEINSVTGATIHLDSAAILSPQPPTSAEASQPEIQPVLTINRSRVSLGVLLSPDLSSVGFFNHLTPGTNVGVQAEFRFASRLRVGLGVIRSVKRYQATTEDYQAPYGFWTYGVKPSRIDADCKILDIPLSLRYDAWQQQKFNVFVSTGLSSYVMLSETYNYTYDVYDPSHLRPSWRGKRTGQHYLGVANFSVGYERQLTRRVSWQVEPFVKLPLGGVGFGKVKLMSTGVFLSAKYYFGQQ